MDNPNFSHKIFSSLSLDFISMYLNNCWSFRNIFNVVQTKSLTYFNMTPFIPSHFNTRHLFSRNLIPCTLMLFAHNSATLLPLSTSILKKTGVGGCPVAKPLTCKFEFEAKTAHAPDCAYGICAAEEGRRRRPRPPRRKLLLLPCAADTPPKQRGQRTQEQKDRQVLVLNKS